MKSPERLNQAAELFHAVLERPPIERARFLAEACATDRELLEEVQSFLSAHEESSDFMNTPAFEEAPSGGQESTSQSARFAPGMLLAKRYRIVGLLGKGGMGEVYRAEDLKLGQPVALKFLTDKLSQDQAMLARFHGEVAMAHRVTHANVCRVHDIGEVPTSAGTLHFLSMEYIDGEDLSSLLRRIGRLSADKAVEIARQLCAGLAAAHEAGVLHRDLKPANVMLDGRGRVRITDFGLAGLVEQFRGPEVTAGTPAYMAPEQFAGQEVTVKSDLYALGLVLYEIFTGKQVFAAGTWEELRRLHESSAPATPSSWVKDLDPLVERVILRCLEKDPAKRLASAQQVADALPGGDPLRAALALNETPSPEIVAAAGEKIGLRPRVAVACLVAIIGGLLAATNLISRTRLIDVTPFEQPPEALARQARQIIAQLGYPARPTDTAHGFDYDRQYLNYVRRQVPAGERWQRLRESRPAAIFFWCRESPRQLVRMGWSIHAGNEPEVGRVKEDDPPPKPGMVSIRLDMQGRLIRFSAEPPQLDPVPSPAPSEQADWARLFTAAGIDAARLTPTEAQWTPPNAFDARAAWTGTFPEWPDLALRVEAATWHGRPVYFEVLGPWATPDQGTARGPAAQYSIWQLFILFFVFLWLGWVLVRRNLRQGRSDRKGAFKLAAFMFLSLLFAGVVGSFIPTLQSQELGIRQALTSAGLMWLLYVMLEPYVRRRWPVTLISWNRVLAGKWRDPLVGRDVLFGILVGIFPPLTYALRQSVSPRLGAFPITSNGVLGALSDGRQAISLFVFYVVGVAGLALVFVFLLFLLRLLTHRDWLAVSLFTLGYAVIPLFAGDWLSAIWEGLIYGLYALVLTRYGLLTLVSALPVASLLLYFPVTLNFSVWYAGTALLTLLAILALAALAFYTSLGGQQVFAEEMLEE